MLSTIPSPLEQQTLDDLNLSFPGGDLAAAMPLGIFSPACSQYSQPRHASSISAYIPPRHLSPPQPTYLRTRSRIEEAATQAARPPQNADEDPYTLAVMIALAQRPGADGAKVEVRVVTTSTQKNGHILHVQGNRAWHAPGSV
ncbi:hypothetical protein PG995_009079 [Apiospora arundinis]